MWIGAALAAVLLFLWNARVRLTLSLCPGGPVQVHIRLGPFCRRVLPASPRKRKKRPGGGIFLRRVALRLAGEGQLERLALSASIGGTDAARIALMTGLLRAGFSALCAPCPDARREGRITADFSGRPTRLSLLCIIFWPLGHIIRAAATEWLALNRRRFHG